MGADTLERQIGYVFLRGLVQQPGQRVALTVPFLNGKLRDEFLNREIFSTLKEAQILIERWRREYNTVRPHSALGYRPLAPGAIQVMPRDPGYAMLRQDQGGDLMGLGRTFQFCQGLDAQMFEEHPGLIFIWSQMTILEDSGSQ